MKLDVSERVMMLSLLLIAILLLLFFPQIIRAVELQFETATVKAKPGNVTEFSREDKEGRKAV